MRRSNVKTGLLGLVSLLIAGALFSLGYIKNVDATEVPSPEFIAASLQDQASVALEVSFVRDIERVGAKEPLAYKAVSHYVRTPDVLRLDKTDVTGAVAGRSISASYDRGSRTGEQLYSASKPSKWRKYGRSGNRLLDPLGNQDVLECALYPVYGGELANIVRQGNVGGLESIDGHDCWRVELPIPEGFKRAEKQLVWLDPRIGFCPRRFEVTWHEGDPMVVTFTDYTEICDGKWFPKRQRIEAPVQEEGEQYLVVHQVQVDNIRCLTTLPDRSELIVSFPSGTRVYDEGSDNEYVVP